MQRYRLERWMHLQLDFYRLAGTVAMIHTAHRKHVGIILSESDSDLTHVSTASIGRVKANPFKARQLRSQPGATRLGRQRQMISAAQRRRKDIPDT
jgi:hypothetical protein